MQTLNIIENLCGDLADHRRQLRRKFEARQKAVIAAAEPFDADIRAIQCKCSGIRDTLISTLTTARDQFSKRKTQEFAGIVVGFEKERDSLTLPPDEILVDRIEKMLPAAQSKTLLDRTVTVIKAAFKKLPVETLQRLGCSLVKGGDKAIVRANDDDIESLVSKTLGGSSHPSPESLPSH